MNAQNSNFKEKKESILKDISKSEAKIKSLIVFGFSKDIPIKFSTVIPVEAKPVKLSSTKFDLKSLKEKIKKANWTQDVVNNETKITLDSEGYEDFIAVNNIELNNAILNNITFYNHKKLNLKVEENVRYDGSVEFLLKIKQKRIKSFDLTLLFQFEEFTDFKIDKKELFLSSLQITDIQINNNMVSFLKKNNEKNKNIEVYAMAKDGLYYERTGMSSMSKFSVKEINYFKEILLFFEDVKTVLKKDKFKTEKEFKNYISSNQPEEYILSKKEEREKQTLYNFDFPIQPEKLLFRVLEQHQTSEITISFKEDSNEIAFIAKSNYKVGVIDREGNWIVKPKYEFLSKNKYFPGYYNAHNKTVYISSSNTEINSYDFFLEEDPFIVKKWYKTGEYRSEAGHGLFDVKNKKFILPINRNTYIKNHYSYYFVKKYQDNDTILTALFDFEGAKIFDFENQDISLSVNKIFKVTKGGKVSLYQLDTVSKEIKLLTTRLYTSINTPHIRTSIEEQTERPLFRADKNRDETSDYLTFSGKIAIDGKKYSNISCSYDRFIVRNNAGVYSILDKQGTLIKELCATTIPKKEYSNYLLQVQNKKTKLYGYINKSGAMVIPFMYSTATRFVKEKKGSKALALVSIKDKAGNISNFAIDLTNNLVGKKEVLKRNEYDEKEEMIHQLNNY